MATATNPEDVGYETARIKGVDVLGQVAVMLRQRGLRIHSVGGVAVREDDVHAQPIPSVPTDAEQAGAEAWLQRCLCAPGVRITTSAPWQPALVAVVPPDAPAGSAAQVHVERGLESVGDETWVFLVVAENKVRIKHLRAVQQTYAEAEGRECPRRVLVVSREKIQPASVKALHGGSEARPVIAERFLLGELSYNVTRHFLVPRHRICTPDEVARLRRKYGKMALQSRDDVITRFYGLLPGDVIVYHRQRLGSFGGDYFREVV
jgi:DNA-directed RNA polymerase subunit H (RpoH/RPB5)